MSSWFMFDKLCRKFYASGLFNLLAYLKVLVEAFTVKPAYLIFLGLEHLLLI